MPLSELMKEADWWDFPNAWHGFAGIVIGGERVRIDFTKGSVPTVIRRPYFPC